MSMYAGRRDWGSSVLRSCTRRGSGSNLSRFGQIPSSLFLFLLARARAPMISRGKTEKVEIEARPALPVACARQRCEMTG